MSLLRYAAKFVPFLSLDCAWLEGGSSGNTDSSLHPARLLVSLRQQQAERQSWSKVTTTAEGSRKGREEGGGGQARERVKLDS